MMQHYLVIILPQKYAFFYMCFLMNELVRILLVKLRDENRLLILSSVVPVVVEKEDNHDNLDNFFVFCVSKY